MEEVKTLEVLEVGIVVESLFELDKSNADVEPAFTLEYDIESRTEMVLLADDDE